MKQRKALFILYTIETAKNCIKTLINHGRTNVNEKESNNGGVAE